MAAQAQLQYLTKCRLCGASLTHAPFVTSLNHTTDPALIEFVTKLSKHLGKAHPNEHLLIFRRIEEFTGFASVSLFEIQDPLLLSMQEAIRASLHRATRKTYVTNAEIEARINELGIFGEDAQGLNILLRDMRDLLCEEGVYAPSGSPAQQPLVVP